MNGDFPDELTVGWDDVGPSCTDVQIAAVEALLGCTLPSDYTAFLRRVNGGSPPFARSQFRDGSLRLLYGIGLEDEACGLETRARWPYAPPPDPELIQIGYDEGSAAILLCIAGVRRGEVWFWNTSDLRPEGANPRVAWSERRDMHRLAATFCEFLGSLTPSPLA